MELSERERQLIGSALFLYYIRLGDERKNSDLMMLDPSREIYDASRKLESEIFDLYNKIKKEV